MAMTKTGPNDTKHVIWAICKSFLFFFNVFTNILYLLQVLIHFIDCSKRRIGLELVAMTKTGPNDAKRVVWAICMFFLKISCFY